MRGVARALGVLAMVVVAVAGGATVARAADDGRPLQVPDETLRRSLHCTSGVRDAHRTPVLLIPGTTLTPKENFSWNYQRAFDRSGRPYCTVTLPNHGMSDIQISAEYVVYAMRTMAKMSGRRIAVIGHSQGGMIGRWALKFWPDTRDDVEDLIGLAPSNHGALDANVLCAPPGGCAPAIWQQRAGSKFLTALNADRETYPGIDYTVVYTNADEVVTPNIDPPSLTAGVLPPDLAPPASSPLRDGGNNVRNIAVQSVCPGHATDHLLIGTSDPVAYALAIDAVDHPGPVDPSRIDRSVCLAPYQPGVNPVTFPTDFANLTAVAGQQIALYPHVPAEPPLQPYARASASRS